MVLHVYISSSQLQWLIYFFDEINLSLNKAALKFENFIVMGDLNIDVNASASPGKDKLDEFCNLFDLTNLVIEVTCCTNNHSSTIDLILTNRPDFQKICTNETGVSDYHKCISTISKLHHSKPKPKVIHYTNYKNFDESLFLNYLEKSTFLTNFNCSNENYQHLTENFFFGSWKACSSKKNCKRQSSSICK